MKKLAVFGLLLCAATAVLAAQQRIVTNREPEPLLRRLFPAAAAFSPHQGEPLHFKAYASDPAQNPDAPLLGYAFWTTDLVPKVWGYHGPIHMLVGMDLSGILTGVIVDYNSDPYGYFSVEPPKFGAQFTGKSVRDPFKVGEDVDRVSRATITILAAARALRESTRMMARAFLSPEDVK